MLSLVVFVWIVGVGGAASTPFVVDCLSVDANGRCVDDSLVFSRIDMTSDTHKHLAVRMHAYSRETVAMTVMLLFRSPQSQINASARSGQYYHNALLINHALYPFIHAVSRQSNFAYRNHLPIVAKSRRHRALSYDVVQDPHHWQRLTKTSAVASRVGSLLDGIDPFSEILLTQAGTAATYQAVLALDRASAAWNQYNVLTVDAYQVAMHYVTGGYLSTEVGSDFDQLVRLNCRNNNRDSDDNCRLDTHYAEMGGRRYNSTGYRLIVDLHASINYLPVDLYYRLQALPEAQRQIVFHMTTTTGGESNSALANDTDNRLILNHRFHFEMNRHDSDIIVGVDLLHVFPRVQYSMERREIHLWYQTTSLVFSQQQQSAAIALSFLLLAVLYCQFDAASNDNRRTYFFMVRYSYLSFRWFYFNVRQALIEIATLVLVLLITVLTLIYSDYNASDQFQRATLFWILALYHSVVLICCIAMAPEILRQAFIYHLHFDPVVLDKTAKALVVAVPQPQPQPSSGTPIPIPNFASFPKSQSALTRNYLGDRPQQQFIRVLHSTDTVVTFGAGTQQQLQQQQQQQQQPISKSDEFSVVRHEHIDADEANLSRQFTASVLARNTVLIVLLMLCILMILNFSTTDNYLYLMMLFFASLIFLYLFIEHLFVCVLYVAARPVDVPLSVPFVCFLAGEAVALVFYVAWAIPCLYLAFTRAFNSIYSDAFVVAVTLVLLALIFLLVCQRMDTRLERMLRRHYYTSNNNIQKTTATSDE